MVRVKYQHACPTCGTDHADLLVWQNDESVLCVTCDKTFNPASEQPIWDELARIALRKCQVTTLDERGRDALDFHEIHVASLRDALRAAYEAGRKAGS